MTDEPARPTSGMLGIIGLSPVGLLVVAGLTFAVWWYYASLGQRLDTAETAVVAVVMALLVALVLAVRRAVRRARPKVGPPDQRTPP